ncbi:MAG: pyridoxal-phosphate dependent enzyme, partial [Candidatus Kapabacteria bacterium]|nr:pyridoxal-phosphate dependent enzyme [Candidatus Kapabacteria bacterium]
HDTQIYMPNWLSRERVDVIRALGATIHLVSKEDGGFLGSIAMAEQFAAENGNVFLPCQFTNEHNIEAHELTTGVEIASQLASVGKTPDAFVAGVGTGGTVMGVARTLRRVNPDVRIHPLEPAESPTLTTGYKVGSHRIQGISDEFIPAIVDLSSLDPVISVSDGDAIMMAQKISASLGLAVGISSGANFIGALKALETLEPDATVATIFCDCNKKYLSTDLMKEQPVREGYYSPRVELLGVTVIPRLP